MGGHYYFPDSLNRVVVLAVVGTKLISWVNRKDRGFAKNLNSVEVLPLNFA